MYSQLSTIALLATLAVVVFSANPKSKPAPPKPKPKPKPRPTRCADVLLYDTFGDSWGSDVVFQAGQETFQFLDVHDSAGSPFPSDQNNCSYRVLQFCDSKEYYNFTVTSFEENVEMSDWEVFWAVRYDRKSYFGTVGSSIIIDGTTVEFSEFYDESPHANKCPMCSSSSGHPVSMRDARGDGWYAAGFSDIGGFRVPNLLTYPRYYISNDADGSIVSEGTLCRGDNSTCTNELKNGNYVFRVGGHAKGDETWEFCGVEGIVGEELSFIIAGGSCLPTSKKDSAQLCLSTTSDVAEVSIADLAAVDNEHVITMSSETDTTFSSLNSGLNYFLSCVVFSLGVVAVILKFSKKEEFERLPSDSSH